MASRWTPIRNDDTSIAMNASSLTWIKLTESKIKIVWSCSFSSTSIIASHLVIASIHEAMQDTIVNDLCLRKINTYRHEIDEMRALAVISVSVFHAKFSFVSGGFVRVDVFFVNSGYLITSIILSEHEAEIFSLVTFHERRARRILPAILLIVFLCIPFAA